jgi:hypothetical protein
LKFTEEDYDFDMPDGSGTSSRLVFKLIHPGIVKCFIIAATVLLMPSTLVL